MTISGGDEYKEEGKKEGVTYFFISLFFFYQLINSNSYKYI